jgi:hypothetical protein
MNMKAVQFSLILALASSLTFTATAQSVNADYDRNSMTILSVEHRDGLDAVLKNYLSRDFPGGEKFDQTRIATTTVVDDGARYRHVENGGVAQERAYLNTHRSRISAQLFSLGVAPQIIGAWFNRSKDGMMDISVIKSRADYNASDATVNIAGSQALGRYLLQSEGVSLVGNSYVLVVDHARPTQEYRRDSKGSTTGVDFRADAFGYLYKVDFSDVERQKVYDCWIYPEDSATERARKNEAWSKIRFNLSPVTEVYTTGHASKTFTQKDRSTDGLMEKSIEDCVRAVIAELDDHVEGWQVKSSIYSVHPVTSKIGTKEGLKNMDRYQVEEFLLDENGNITPRKKGYVRATSVNNNSTVATGHSGVSEFFQIAGGKLEPGMRLTQKKDLGISVKALYYIGATAGYGAELDLPFSMKTSGSCFHVKIAGSGKSLGTVNGRELSAIDARIGMGYGIRPIRQVELIPTAFVVLDGFNEKGTKFSMDNNKCWGAEVGVDMELTVFYPVKLIGGAFYDLPVLADSYWRENYDALEANGIKRMNGLTYRAGIVIEF